MTLIFSVFNLKTFKNETIKKLSIVLKGTFVRETKSENVKAFRLLYNLKTL